MAVVFYHFGLPWFSGGFAGVDVFFVISGYLMCGIVLRGLDADNFSLWRFYLSRARRIWPALTVVCMACLVAGWFLLIPKEYQTLGGHIRKSLLFTSNLGYLDESGYFDVASQEKWLLHTWSLSVEWQFYLVFPVLLMLLRKVIRNERALFLSLLTIALLSFCWNIAQTENDRPAAFFTLQTRAWEMLAGALVFLYSRHRSLAHSLGRVAEIAGFMLIVSTIILVNTHSPWPGALAALPVLGAMLILLAARNDSLLTASPIAQWLGSRSYSIYLWHWPLVVAIAYLQQLDNPWLITGGILLSLILGHLSWHYVETPIQRYLTHCSARKAALLLIISLLIVAALAQMVRRNGIPGRLPESIAVVYEERNNSNPRNKECLDFKAHCLYGTGSVQAVVIGDSHADSIVTAVQAAVPEGKGSILLRANSNCPIVFGMHSSSNESCQAFNEQLEREHKDFPPSVPVILMGRTSEYVNGGQVLNESKKPFFHFLPKHQSYSEPFLQQFAQHYVDTICQISRYRPVYLVRPTPEMVVDVPTRLSRELILGNHVPDIVLARSDYHARHAYIWNLQDQAVERCNARILDPLPWLCDERRCYGSQNGKPFYRDHNHMSESGNRLLIPLFKTVFTQP